MIETINPRTIVDLSGPILLVFLRVQSCILALPSFGSSLFPKRVRFLIASAISIFLWPNALPTNFTSTYDLIYDASSEILIGIILGLSVRVFSLSLDIAASTVAATSSLSQFFGMANDAPPHPVGNLFHLYGVTLLLVIGLPISACRLIQTSFDLMPVGSWPKITDMSVIIVYATSKSFQLAIILSLPFILSSYLFNIILAQINKVMPTLPIAFISAPALMLASLAMLSFSSTSILRVWATSTLSFSEWVLR